MAGTRSSSRLAGQKSSPLQPTSSPKTAAGSKRKSEQGASPTAKRGRKSADKDQKTIEETMDVEDADSTAQNPPTAQKDNSDAEKTTEIDNSKTNDVDKPSAPAKDEAEPANPTENGSNKQVPSSNGHKVEDDNKSEPEPAKSSSEMDSTGKIEPKDESLGQSQEENEPAKNGNSAVEAHARDNETPSSILEKGIIYFFFRGRTGIDNPADVNDIARSYMILRPIPHGAKLGDGPIGDGNGKCRLLALPKKVLPLSGKDKFMTFVEKAKTTFKELKDDFLSASDYDTKTAGVRHSPSATPLAEGVYAITTTGRESHLAYMITIPQELGELQKDIGLREQGSFITSVKNPEYAGPANTNLPEGPGFPKEIMDEFRSLRWAPLQPKFLDYENTQFLLIGESSGIDKATEQQPEDKEKGKDDPKEELEKLEGEDEIRIKHLEGNSSVFTELGVSKKDYPKVPSTWD